MSSRGSTVGFGKLSAQQRQALAPFVSGQVVHDLGAGDLRLSRELLKLGAKQVIAVDKEPMLNPPEGVETLRASFAEAHSLLLDTPIDVAFLSWPANYNTLIEPLLEMAKTVIYLGKNTDGTACGTPRLYRSFLQRELLWSEPHTNNSLIVMGGKIHVDAPRLPTGEELAGLEVEFSLDIFSFEQAEDAARQPW